MCAQTASNAPASATIPDAHIYVINLERAKERRERISAQLERLGLPYTIFPAVDGRTITHETLARAYAENDARSTYREMTHGEIACALSHIGVYQRILEEGHRHALVLEDDALLGESVPQVLSALSALMQADSPDVVLLNHVDKYTNWGRKSLAVAGNSDVRLVKRYGQWWRAHGYFLTRAAARSLHDALLPVRSAADYWARFEGEGIIRLRAVVPCCIGLTELAENSTLESQRAVKVEGESRRNFAQVLYRYGYQRFLHQLLVRPFLRVSRQRTKQR